MKTLYRLFFYAVLPILLSFTPGFQPGTGNSDLKILTDIVPCELLSGEQVETVLPGHDEGFTAHSGGSLMNGVDSYQCSYTNEKMDLFTVIVHVAADEDKFSWIKPTSSSSGTELKIGDGGWLDSEQDELKLEASKGLKVIELNLMAPNAPEKTDALIKIASALLDKI